MANPVDFSDVGIGTLSAPRLTSPRPSFCCSNSRCGRCFGLIFASAPVTNAVMLDQAPANGPACRSHAPCFGVSADVITGFSDEFLSADVVTESLVAPGVRQQRSRALAMGRGRSRS